MSERDHADPCSVLFSVFFGETTPENLTGEIRAFGPSHVVILDAADLGRRPGTVELVPVDAPSLSVSASTHGLPLEVLANYLRQSIGCDVLVLGIQPASRQFGRPPSKSVRLPPAAPPPPSWPPWSSGRAGFLGGMPTPPLRRHAVLPRTLSCPFACLRNSLGRGYRLLIPVK